MTLHRLLAASIAAALTLAGATSHAHAADAPLPIRALLGPAADAPAPGCALAVFRDGKLASLATNGYANIEKRIPIDGDTVFYAASISKQFTALALVQLSLQGKLDLDGDLRQWIPELPQYAATVTPRMILQHRTGILDSLSLVSLGSATGVAATTSREDTLALTLAQTTTNFVPGTATYYSNGAYLIASELIQRVSGERYPDYIKRHILDPIGMSSSYMLDGEPLESPHRAHGYAASGDGYQIRDTYPRYGGSGGLMFTINDLARYEYDIEHGHKVWTPQVRAIMEAPGKLTDGSLAYTGDRDGGMIYALGLMVGERKGRWIVEHGGGAEAFRHMYSRVPKEKFAAAALCNRADSFAADRVNAAISLSLPATAEDTASRPVTGLYKADTLPVQYVAWPLGSDKLRLAIVADGESVPRAEIELLREADTAAGGKARYASPAAYVEAVGSEAIELGTDRARGLRATRINK